MERKWQITGNRNGHRSIVGPIFRRDQHIEPRQIAEHLGISVTAAKVRQLESFWEQLATAAGATDVATVRSANQLAIGGDQ